MARITHCDRPHRSIAHALTPRLATRTASKCTDSKHNRGQLHTRQIQVCSDGARRRSRRANAMAKRQKNHTSPHNHTHTSQGPCTHLSPRVAATHWLRRLGPVRFRKAHRASAVRRVQETAVRGRRWQAKRSNVEPQLGRDRRARARAHCAVRLMAPDHADAQRRPPRCTLPLQEPPAHPSERTE